MRANLFEREGALSTFVPVLPYLPVAPDVPDIPKYDDRDSRGYVRGHNDLPANDEYGSYGGIQVNVHILLLVVIETQSTVMRVIFMVAYR